MNPPDVSTVMSVYSKYPKISEKQFANQATPWDTMMASLGYGENARSWFKKATTAVLPYPDAVIAYDRAFFPKNTTYTLDYIRKQNNIPKELAGVYTNLAKWYPSLSDLNLWFIRNVYDDKVVKRYNLDAYIKDITIPGMGTGYDIYKHLGLNDTFAKLEWYATWRMPSFYQAMYMYNWYLGNKNNKLGDKGTELKFDENDFEYAMRVANWPPYFQKLLKQITSHPPTRIMVEQFYQAGIIKEADLSKWFDWAGYHGVINDNLVKFTKVQRSPGHKKTIKTATVSLLNKMYMHSKITQKDYETNMSDLGYSNDLIKLYEAYIALDEQLQYERVVIQYMREKYMKESVSDTVALDTLTKAGVTTNIANEYILKWKTAKIRSRRYLSVTDLDKMYTKKILNANEILEYLQLLGYDLTDSQRIMKLKDIPIKTKGS